MNALSWATLSIVPGSSVWFSDNKLPLVVTGMISNLALPLRRRIQNFIDKRFYRRKYDAAKVLAAFATSARDETDLERLTAELLRVVDETVQPEFVGLWLRKDGPKTG